MPSARSLLLSSSTLASVCLASALAAAQPAQPATEPSQPTAPTAAATGSTPAPTSDQTPSPVDGPAASSAEATGSIGGEPAAPASSAPAEASDDTAAPAAEVPEAAPKMLLLPQNAPVSGPRTFHYHDGFYLRANFGLGLLWGGFETATPDRTLDADGSGIALDVLVGGSPSPGFVVGGGFMGNWLFSAEFTEDGEGTSQHDITSGLIGVFVDGFPVPSGGWHLGGLVGLGGHTLSQDALVDKTGGFGGAIWAGYDQWVGDDFSVGGLLRFTAMRSTGEEDGLDLTASTASLAILFTALYH